MYDGELLSDLQLHTAAGYIEGMLLTFFEFEITNDIDIGYLI